MPRPSSKIAASKRAYNADYHQRNRAKANAYNKAYRAKNRERLSLHAKQKYAENRESLLLKARRYRSEKRPHLLRNFGITGPEYDAMWNHQGGLCAICNRPEKRTHRAARVRLAVDHCHETRKVRGLLCRDCNTALGLMQDSLFIVSQAQVYLTAHA